MVKTFKTFLNFSCFVRHPVDLIEGGGGEECLQEKMHLLKCYSWDFQNFKDTNNESHIF